MKYNVNEGTKEESHTVNIILEKDKRKMLRK